MSGSECATALRTRQPSSRAAGYHGAGTSHGGMSAPTVGCLLGGYVFPNEICDRLLHHSIPGDGARHLGTDAELARARIIDQLAIVGWDGREPARASAASDEDV